MEKIYRVQMNSKGMPNFATAVEIADRLVYCEECDYWQNRHLCKFWSKHGTIETVEDDFCSYGYQKGADNE